MKPRMTIATITTSNEELVEKAKLLRKDYRITHEEIYARGIEEITKDYLDK